MELYTLGENDRRESVVDMFESLIWTDRFADQGDFEMVIDSTPINKKLLADGVRVACNSSDRVMTIETSVDKTSSDGLKMLTITGRSLERILEDRPASNGRSNAKWTITGPPAAIARNIFTAVITNGGIHAADKIPNLYLKTPSPVNTIPEPNTPITMEVELQSVYSVIKSICDIYGLGFRITRDLVTKRLNFEIYSGNNKTTQQSAVPAVIFSPDLDNLSDVTELTSIANYKNVCYVYNKNAVEIVYADGVDPSVSGLDRRVLFVKADDIDLPAGAALTAALIQKGKDELSQTRRLQAFDGEIPQFGSYKYNVDYGLGDLVEMRTDEGTTNLMRVTEQIFVHDAEGERAYPTLALDLFITPGSWAAWDFNMTWSEAEGVWKDI